MSEQELASSFPIDDGADCGIQGDDLVEIFEKNNVLLSEILDKMATLIARRNSAWRERRVVEENFLLEAEARQQRLEQLSRIMTPRPESSDFLFQYEHPIETSNAVPGAQSTDENGVTLDLAETSPQDSHTQSQSPEVHGNLESCPGNSFFENILFETTDCVPGISSEQSTASGEESSDTPLIAIDITPGRRAPQLSVGELREKLAADLVEIHKLIVARLGLVEPISFWSEILERVNQMVAPSEDHSQGFKENSNTGRQYHVDTFVKDSGLNSTVFSD